MRVSTERQRRCLLLLVWVAMLLQAATALADVRSDYLVRLLRGSSQFRVRAHAAISRAKGEVDSAGVDALIEALRDEHPAVRAAAAGALGQAGDTRALGALQALERDPEAPVRDAAQTAIARLRRAQGGQAVATTARPGPTPGNARFYVAVGTPAAKGVDIDSATLARAREFIERKVSNVEGVVLAPQDETPAVAKRALAKNRLTGYYLETAVTQVQQRPDGGTRVAVSVIVATYPGKDMRAILQGAATAMGQGPSIKRQALEGAFNGALRRLPQALR